MPVCRVYVGMWVWVFFLMRGLWCGWRVSPSRRAADAVGRGTVCSLGSYPGIAAAPMHPTAACEGVPPQCPCGALDHVPPTESCVLIVVPGTTLHLPQGLGVTRPLRHPIVMLPPPPPCPTNTVSNEHFLFGPYFFGT